MPRSKGLGDSIDKFTTATGIKKAVKTATGGGCGACQKRREKLNKMFPYKNGNASGVKGQSTGKTNRKIGPNKKS